MPEPASIPNVSHPVTEIIERIDQVSLSIREYGILLADQNFFSSCGSIPDQLSDSLDRISSDLSAVDLSTPITNVVESC